MGTLVAFGGRYDPPLVLFTLMAADRFKGRIWVAMVYHCTMPVSRDCGFTATQSVTLMVPTTVILFGITPTTIVFGKPKIGWPVGPHPATPSVQAAALVVLNSTFSTMGEAILLLGGVYTVAAGMGILGKGTVVIER